MSSKSLDKTATSKQEINIFNDEEIFLKFFLKNFYHKIIETNDFNYFEKILMEWINYYLEINDKNPQKILELMRNHEESKSWFTSLMGFFYQLGIGCDLDRKKAMESYFLAISNETEKDSLIVKDKDTFDLSRNQNFIIGKYLLSLFYYRDIILDIEGFNYNQSKKVEMKN